MDIETVKPTNAQKKAQRSRSLAVALALAAFVVLVYLMTIVRLGPTVLDRAM
ncbi:MAG: hypothetical protein AB7I79_07840 [Rhizobiaceae bacterium]